MQPSMSASRIKIGAAALAIAGIFFVLYPAIRPFSDEASLDGAKAFASNSWLAAHLLAIVAFTLIPVGLLGLYFLFAQSKVDRHGYWGLVSGVIGVGLTLPFYGGEAYGLHAIGQEAINQGNAALLSQAAVVRSGTGLIVFLTGLLLIGVASVVTAIGLWKSDKFSIWSGLPFALGFILYIPQFFWNQPLRVAHGVLVAIGCLWIAAGMWAQPKSA